MMSLKLSNGIRPPHEPKYKGRRLIFKGRVDYVNANGRIFVMGMMQESKGYGSRAYAACCRMKQDRRLLDAVKTINNSSCPVVWVKGIINDVSNASITVDTKKLACFN